MQQEAERQQPLEQLGKQTGGSVVVSGKTAQFAMLLERCRTAATGLRSLNAAPQALGDAAASGNGLQRDRHQVILSNFVTYFTGTIMM